MELAEEYDVSKSTIYNTLRREGVKRRSTGKDPVFLDEKERKKVARKYEEGEKVKGIAEEYNVNRSTVRNIAKRYGVKIKTNKKLDEEDHKDIAEKYKEGKSGPELAEEYGVNNQTIYDALERMGVDRKRR